MQHIAHAADNIGWTHCTEGKILLLLKALHANYIAHCLTISTIDVWMRRFIGQLLKLTHSQWIFRNITKHHLTNVTIKLEAQEDVLREVERQLDLGLESLPPECKLLLKSRKPACSVWPQIGSNTGLTPSLPRERQEQGRSS